MEYIATIGFIALVILSFLKPSVIKNLRQRTVGEWILDGIGLVLQGFVASLLVSLLIATAARLALPQLSDAISLPAWASFLMSFLAVDYCFYWSHRLFHQQSLFPIHLVHHSSERMDIFATSRNTLWQPFIFPHVWLSALLLLTAEHSAATIVALQIHGLFDYWNHSGLHPKGKWYKFLQTIFITPRAHEWHHSSRKYRTNYGNTLCIWDKLHGTYYNPNTSPERFGLPIKENWVKMLLYPLGRK